VLPAVFAATCSAEQTVLTERHFWRKHYTFFPPKASRASARAKGLPTDDAARAKFLSRFYFNGIKTPPPSADWKSFAFDDSGWQLSRGRQFTCGDRRVRRGPAVTSVYLRGTDAFVEEVGLICQRSRFIVNDPSKVRSLKLRLACRGGFVAYLNGVEIARGWLPEGEIKPTTAADDYPLKAYFVADTIGTKKPKYLSTFNRDWKPDRDNPQWALRERTFGPQAIDLKGLRKGVNVLAIELHRSDYPAECKRKVSWKEARSLGWSPVGLSLLGLSVDADAGAVASAGPRPNGLQVWSRDVSRPVAAQEYPNADESAPAMRIVGVHNGAFSGQVVIRDEKPLAAVAVTISDLKAAGKGAIPASAVTIRYGAVNPTYVGRGVDYLTAVVPVDGPAAKRKPRKGVPLGRFDSLLPRPPLGRFSMPVWVTVAVPEAAAAGDYSGMLTIKVGGRQPVEVPVTLNVADWTLPDVTDYAGLLNIYQSPDTLARFYGLKRWSEKHWAVIESSLKMMGEAGNIGLFFPLLAESQMGNVESMVVWERQKDGSFKHDFTVFDRYLDTAMKHHDPRRLRFLSLNVWGSECDAKRNVPMVTARDGPTGTRTLMQLPAYGTRACEDMWRPVLLGAKKHLEARKLGHLLRLGLPDDRTPHWSHVRMFHNIVPGAAWVRESHFRRHHYVRDGKDQKKITPVAYNSIVWSMGIPDPETKRLYGWKHSKPGYLEMNFNRAGTTTALLLGYPAPWAYRSWMEATLCLGRAGNGRVGGDYWKIGARFVGSGRISSEASGGSRGTLFGIYLKSAVGQVGIGNSTTDLFAPGPDGPVPTVRFMNALEGNAEAEAKVFIEKALLDKADPLPADLARAAQDLLDERTNLCRFWRFDAAEIGWAGWQDRAKALYDMAARVRRARK